MRSVTVLALSLIVAAPCAAAAAERVSVQSVANAAGYTMRWLGPERAVSLSRPGIAIVLRPGNVVYDVNTHEEITDSPPSVTASGELLISSALASHLRALAQQAAYAQRSGPVLLAVEAPMHGAIVMEARQLPGSESLTVNGQAPRNAPITITLLASLAPELPSVLLSRHDVQSDLYGRFTAVVPVAPDYLAGSVITVVATSAAGVTPASARVVLESLH